ncbi:M56 family metallopeptidase [Mucilaginibacter lappiensis]|uniref:M56 family metallopeptidase n=1 Tax=Mucilaginibacter lappiensis TaxID=354630 RepID=UPI003D19326A
MPVLFVFLLKVNIALLLFCAGYYLVLRHLTFYTLNRVYLLAAILFASIYPEINLSAFVQGHEALARPVQQVVINWQGPVQNLIKPLSQPNYWHWAEVIFWLGAYIFALRLAVQLFSLYKLYKSSKPAMINNHQVRIMDKDAAPFSFWQSIFVNPSKHEPADLKAILLHEQVHVNEWHTADILLAELSSIFYWFNPGIWLIKKAIRENIEFITDRKILNNGIDSKSYQYSLISVSFNNQQPSIVNHFNISTIKKRIIMMNAKRSSKLNLTRYAFLVPAVITLLLVFSISKADFAKPIRVKLVNAAAPLAKIIISSNVNEKLPVKPVAAAKPKKVSRKAAKLLPVVKPDTIKKALIINSNNDKDSIAYYINGVKGSLKSVDPDNIAEMKVIKGNQLPAYINTAFINKNDIKNAGVVLIVTKDSPEGKLKSAPSNDVIVTGYRVSPSVSVTGTTVKTYPTSSVTANTNVSVAHSATNVDSVIKVNVKSSTKANVIRVISASNVSVDGKSTSSHNISIDNDKGIHLSFDKNKNPLILVDGKEIPAADIKKLNPNTIASMTVLNDETSAKKYGDKAKNGVVVITTNKK